MYNGVTGIYYELFNFMEDEEILDPFNEFNLVALHYMFFPVTNDKLDAWLQAWSKHRLGTIQASPIRLWVSSQINSTPDGDLGPEQLLHYGVEGLVGDDDNEIADNGDPIFCSSLEVVLTDGVLSALQREVPFQSHPEN